MDIDLKKATEESGTFAKEKTLRLRNENRQKILAEGFLTLQPDGSYRIGNLELANGAELEIKIEEAWVGMQLEQDEQGKFFLSSPTCSLIPLRAYARYWGKSGY